MNFRLGRELYAVVLEAACHYQTIVKYAMVSSHNIFHHSLKLWFCTKLLVLYVTISSPLGTIFDEVGYIFLRYWNVPSLLSRWVLISTKLLSPDVLPSKCTLLSVASPIYTFHPVRDVLDVMNTSYVSWSYRNHRNSSRNAWYDIMITTDSWI